MFSRNKNEELKKCYNEINIKNLQIHDLISDYNEIMDKYIYTNKRLEERTKEVRHLNKTIRRLLNVA